MHRKGIADVPELLGILADFQVPLYICEMSMSLIGISRHELIEYPRLETCGVAVFLDNASHSATTLFI